MLAKHNQQYIITLCVRCDTDGDPDYSEEEMLNSIAELVDTTYGATCPVEIEACDVEEDEEGDDE